MAPSVIKSLLIAKPFRSFTISLGLDDTVLVDDPRHCRVHEAERTISIASKRSTTDFITTDIINLDAIRRISFDRE